ncbi:MAG: S8 family serine peptidase, partial [Xenococcus sp. (in: cyanobacteria)]
MLRRILNVFLLLFIIIGFQILLPTGQVDAQELISQPTYYYHDGERVNLEVNFLKNYVLFDSQIHQKDLVEPLKSTKGVVRKFKDIEPLLDLNLAQDIPKQEWAIIDNRNLEVRPLQQSLLAEHLLYQAPFFLTENGEEVGVSHLFYVKLKNEEDVTALQVLAQEYKVDILGNNKFMPSWYTLSCSTKSSGNALEVADKFYESGLFAVAEPDFLVNFEIQATNDDLFDDQWGLENTGQNGGTVGIDINASDAWNLTTGDDSIVVAVLDHGIELDHPDMPNISALSFDTVTGTSPSVVRGSHGTACAGIVGAAQNNSQGISGVAPNITLMSISDPLRLGPNASQRLADGLNWAWQNGADVISNSWGHNQLASPLIDDAIDNAINQGRSGLGTVVVFATGNGNGAVIYPANSNPDILAVGAMSPCAERKNPLSCDGETLWGSNFGDEIDVVAPGVLIPTTDRQGAAGYDSGDYTLTFNGTSSATPHVAGIAALILSQNPNLTQEEVVAIIERNAQKVGPYNYQQVPGHDSGTWNNEMGYGLVDAFASLSNLTGTDDIVWQRRDGQVHYWPMSNGQRTGGINIANPVGAQWSLKGVGDVNGDGTDDIVWQRRDGQVHYWPMSNG